MLPIPESELRTVRIRRPISPATKAQVRELWNDRCAYCGAIYSEFHYDHIYPHRLGGPDEWWNLAYACTPCNMAKRDRVLPGDTPAQIVYAFQRERVPGGPYPPIPPGYGDDTMPAVSSPFPSPH